MGFIIFFPALCRLFRVLGSVHVSCVYVCWFFVCFKHRLVTNYFQMRRTKGHLFLLSLVLSPRRILLFIIRLLEGYVSRWPQLLVFYYLLFLLILDSLASEEVNKMTSF